MWNQTLVKGPDGRLPPRIMTFASPAEEASPPQELFDGSYDDDSDDGDEQLPLAKVISYLEFPDHPSFDERKDDEDDEYYKNGTWKDTQHPDLESAVCWKLQRLREITHPEPGDNYSYEEWKAGKTDGQSHKQRKEQSKTSRLPKLDHEFQDVCLERDFREKGLQVIVKLASVELSKSRPEYKGGSWHLEVRRAVLCVQCDHGMYIKTFKSNTNPSGRRE